MSRSFDEIRDRKILHSPCKYTYYTGERTYVSRSECLRFYQKNRPLFKTLSAIKLTEESCPLSNITPLLTYMFNFQTQPFPLQSTLRITFHTDDRINKIMTQRTPSPAKQPLISITLPNTTLLQRKFPPTHHPRITPRRAKETAAGYREIRVGGGGGGVARSRPSRVARVHFAGRAGECNNAMRHRLEIIRSECTRGLSRGPRARAHSVTQLSGGHPRAGPRHSAPGAQWLSPRHQT